MNYSPPGSSVHGILQARILKWLVMPSSRGSSQPRDQTCHLLHCRWILYLLGHQGSPRTCLCNFKGLVSRMIRRESWLGDGCLSFLFLCFCWSSWANFWEFIFFPEIFSPFIYVLKWVNIKLCSWIISNMHSVYVISTIQAPGFLFFKEKREPDSLNHVDNTSGYSNYRGYASPDKDVTLLFMQPVCFYIWVFPHSKHDSTG